MPLISARRKSQLRRAYRKRIHNDLFTVRVYIDEVSEQPNPQLKATTRERYAEFATFRGSIYHMLSGKIGRLFRNIIELPYSVLGLVDQSAYVIQYVPDLYILEAADGVSDNAVPSSVLLQDSAANFEISPIRVGAKVTNTTDESFGFVTSIPTPTSLAVTALTGGTLDLFTAGDAYEIHNVNDLRAGDYVYHLDRWREVLFMIRDSTGVQHSALLGD